MFHNRLAKQIKTNTPINKTIDEYLEHCKMYRRLTKDSIKDMRYALEAFARFVYRCNIKYVEQLTNDHLDRYLYELTSGDKPKKNSTANGYIGFVRCFLEWCRDCQIEVQVKLRQITRLKPEQIERVSFTREQVNEALNYADRRAWLFIKLSFDCGLRISELARIHMSDIHGDRIRIHGKGGKDADVFISHEVELRLKDWIKRENITGYLWEGMNPGEHLCTNQIRRKMREPFYKAGLTNFHPHALRYSCATEAYELGEPSDMIKEILRHNNVETTEKYIQRSEGHIRRMFQSARSTKELLSYDKLTLR